MSRLLFRRRLSAIFIVSAIIGLSIPMFSSTGLAVCLPGSTPPPLLLAPDGSRTRTLAPQDSADTSTDGAAEDDTATDTGQQGGDADTPSDDSTGTDGSAGEVVPADDGTADQPGDEIDPADEPAPDDSGDTTTDDTSSGDDGTGTTSEEGATDGTAADGGTSDAPVEEAPAEEAPAPDEATPDDTGEAAEADGAAIDGGVLGTFFLAQTAPVFCPVMAADPVYVGDTNVTVRGSGFDEDYDLLLTLDWGFTDPSTTRVLTECCFGDNANAGTFATTDLTVPPGVPPGDYKLRASSGTEIVATVVTVVAPFVANATSATELVPFTLTGGGLRPGSTALIDVCYNVELCPRWGGPFTVTGGADGTWSLTVTPPRHDNSFADRTYTAHLYVGDQLVDSDNFQLLAGAPASLTATPTSQRLFGKVALAGTGFAPGTDVLWERSCSTGAISSGPVWTGIGSGTVTSKGTIARTTYMATAQTPFGGGTPSCRYRATDDAGSVDAVVVALRQPARKVTIAPRPEVETDDHLVIFGSDFAPTNLGGQLFIQICHQSPSVDYCLGTSEVPVGSGGSFALDTYVPPTAPLGTYDVTVQEFLPISDLPVYELGQTVDVVSLAPDLIVPGAVRSDGIARISGSHFPFDSEIDLTITCGDDKPAKPGRIFSRASKALGKDVPETFLDVPETGSEVCEIVATGVEIGPAALRAAGPYSVARGPVITSKAVTVARVPVTLSVSPSTPEPGDTLTVTGSGYQPNETVDVVFGFADQVTQTIKASKVDDLTGEWTTTAVVPAGTSGAIPISATGDRGSAASTSVTTKSVQPVDPTEDPVPPTEPSPEPDPQPGPSDDSDGPVVNPIDNDPDVVPTPSDDTVTPEPSDEPTPSPTEPTSEPTEDVTEEATETATEEATEEAVAPVVPPPGGDPERSSFPESLTPPSRALLDLDLLAQNLLMALALILLILASGELFNATFEENYDEIRGWFSWAAAPFAKLRGIPGTGFGHIVSLGVFILVGSVIGCLLDPNFGFNQASFALFLGIAGSLVVLTVIYWITHQWYEKRTHEDSVTVRAIPGGLIIALLCVALSRLTEFQPGYLYGVIAGMAFHRNISLKEEGRVLSGALAVLLVVSVGAWFAWEPIDQLARGDNPAIGILVLDSLLAALFVAGIEILAFGLLPMRFTDGSKVKAFNKFVWLTMLAIGMFAFVHVILHPNTGFQGQGSVFLMWGLFAGFAGFSVSFWAYFRYRSPRAAAHS